MKRLILFLAYLLFTAFAAWANGFETFAEFERRASRRLG
jgi:hypothetical protein